MGCASGENAGEYDSLAGTSKYSPLQEGVEPRLWWFQMPWGWLGVKEDCSQVSGALVDGVMHD